MARTRKRLKQDLELNGHQILSNGTPFSSGGLPPATGPDGAVLRDNGAGAFVIQRLTADDIDPAFSINSFSLGVSGTKEIGDSIVDPNFTASYSATITNPLTINDGTNTDPIALAAQAAFGYNNAGGSGLPARSYSKSVPNQSVTWTLSAKKDPNGPIKNRQTSATWYPKVFRGIVVPGANDEAFIEALPISALQGGRGGTYAFAAGTGVEKIHFAWPTSYSGTPVFKDQNGFVFPMTLVATGVSVTNAFGAVVTYDVWRSDNFLNAAFTITVT